MIWLPFHLKYRINNILDQISKVLPLSDNAKQNYEKLFKSKATFNRELVLIKDLTDEQIASFQVRSFRFPGAFIGKRYRRISQFPELFSHAVGYTSRASANILNLPGIPSRNWKDAEYIYAPGLIEGQLGLEKIYNDSLSGSYGKKIFEIDAKGKLHNLSKSIPGLSRRRPSHILRSCGTASRPPINEW